MTDWQLVLAYLGALGGPALVVALVVVDCKRRLVRRYRGWLVRLEMERSDLAHAPIYCGRQRE